MQNAQSGRYGTVVQWLHAKRFDIVASMKLDAAIALNAILVMWAVLVPASACAQRADPVLSAVPSMLPPGVAEMRRMHLLDAPLQLQGEVIENASERWRLNTTYPKSGSVGYILFRQFLGPIVIGGTIAGILAGTACLIAGGVILEQGNRTADRAQAEKGVGFLLGGGVVTALSGAILIGTVATW
jgi:hypothetical protein